MLGDPSFAAATARWAVRFARQNVTQLVNALVRKDMLRVNDDPADSRRRVLTTTQRSDEYWEHRDADDFAAVAGWFGMLDQDELRGLCDALERVVGQSVSR